MPIIHETRLTGLPGNNPLGFLAGLGALAALHNSSRGHLLHWDSGPIPYPIFTPAISAQEISTATIDLAQEWLDGPALSTDWDPKLKLTKPQIRQYLREARDAGKTGSLALCLIAEDGLDRSGKKAKPTDLYFTAGQQKFAEMAREILGRGRDKELLSQQIESDLTSVWQYDRTGSSLMWDTVDDRQHALSATDPSKGKKLSNPGAELLALLGLSFFPCFAVSGTTVTRSCSGPWKRGKFIYPLWNRPATYRSVNTLLAQVCPPELSNIRRDNWYSAWGVQYILVCKIVRSDQGGYGTLFPTTIAWQSD